jgi:tetratricopeptide (TPR) repeat protein
MLISNPNLDFWAEIDNEESYTDLLMAIEFSDQDRVSLFIAVCDFDLTQSKIINRYTEQLKSDFHTYQVTINSDHLSVNRSISQLVESEVDLQSGGRAVISVVGAAALAATTLDPQAKKSDRDTFFGYLQWTRESFRDFRFPIVLWVSKNIYNLMLSETPDFWSWRTGVFFFKADLETFKTFNFNGGVNVVHPSNLQDRDLDLAAADSIPLADLEQLIERTISRNPEDPLLISLYNQLGYLYGDRLRTGEYDDYLSEQNLAINYFQKAIDLASISSPDLATSLHNLAGLYESMGRYAEAEPLYLRSLTIREEQLGANHPDTANSLNNLALLYKSMGRYAEAEPLYLRSLTIREKQLGANNPDIAQSLNNLALLYESMGRYAAAAPLYLRSLAICEEQLGANHPDTATSLNNLASLYKSMGRYAEAEPLQVRSLAIKEEQLGANHPHTANSLNNLALLYKSMGKYAAAEPLYLRSLAIREEQLGANHPNTANSLNNLASLYKSMGRYIEAEPLYLRSLAICEEQLGANHPHTATSLDNLASLYKLIDRYVEAEPLYVRAVAIAEDKLGINHPSTQTIRENLKLLRQQLAEEG